jgi:hypothetical protein
MGVFDLDDAFEFELDPGGGVPGTVIFRDDCGRPCCEAWFLDLVLEDLLKLFGADSMRLLGGA